MKVETTALFLILAIAGCRDAAQQQPVRSAAADSSWLMLVGDTTASALVATRVRVDTMADSCGTAGTIVRTMPEPSRPHLMVIPPHAMLRAGRVTPAAVLPGDRYDDDAYDFGWPVRMVSNGDTAVLTMEWNRFQMDDGTLRDAKRILFDATGRQVVVVDWLFRYDDDEDRVIWAGDADRDGQPDVLLRLLQHDTATLQLHLSRMRTADTWPAVATHIEPCASAMRPPPEP